MLFLDFKMSNLRRTHKFDVTEHAGMLSSAARAARNLSQLRTADAVRTMPTEELLRDPVLRIAWQRGWNDRGVALDQALQSTSEPQEKRPKQYQQTKQTAVTAATTTRTTTTVTTTSAEPPARLKSVRGTRSPQAGKDSPPSTNWPEVKRRRAPRCKSGTSYRSRDTDEMDRPSTSGVKPGTPENQTTAVLPMVSGEGAVGERTRVKSYARFQDFRARRKAQQAEARQNSGSALPPSAPKQETGTAPLAPTLVRQSTDVDQQAIETDRVSEVTLERAAAKLSLEEANGASHDNPSQSNEKPPDGEWPLDFCIPWDQSDQ